MGPGGPGGAKKKIFGRPGLEPGFFGRPPGPTRVRRKPPAETPRFDFFRVPGRGGVRKTDFWPTAPRRHPRARFRAEIGP